MLLQEKKFDSPQLFYSLDLHSAAVKTNWILNWCFLSLYFYQLLVFTSVWSACSEDPGGLSVGTKRAFVFCWWRGAEPAGRTLGSPGDLPLKNTNDPEHPLITSVNLVLLVPALCPYQLQVHDRWRNISASWGTGGTWAQLSLIQRLNHPEGMEDVSWQVGQRDGLNPDRGNSHLSTPLTNWSNPFGPAATELNYPESSAAALISWKRPRCGTNEGWFSCVQHLSRTRTSLWRTAGGRNTSHDSSSYIWNVPMMHWGQLGYLHILSVSKHSAGYWL